VRIFITAGDPSADAHAARLMAALRLRIPEVVFEGFGGPAMEMQGLRSVAHLKDLAVSGFWEVAKRYGYFRALLKQCQQLLHSRRYDLFLPVDYPGFNLRLATYARSQRIPVAWYIAPQLWAWGSRRAPVLAEAVTDLLVVFPFEVEFFFHHGIAAYYVGHPLIEQLDTIPHVPRTESVLLMPGSRQQEVRHHIPVLQSAMVELRRMSPAPVVVAKAGMVDAEWLSPLQTSGAEIVMDSRTAMRTAGAGLVKAGTSTLEATLLGMPYATFYRTSWASYHLSRWLVDVSSVTMANLLLDRPVVHEYLQQDATGERLAAELLDLLQNEQRRQELAQATAEVHQLLGGTGASERAADYLADRYQKRGR
jgi:lipid-A-disaccharide synthase